MKQELASRYIHNRQFQSQNTTRKKQFCFQIAKGLDGRTYPHRLSLSASVDKGGYRLSLAWKCSENLFLGDTLGTLKFLYSEVSFFRGSIIQYGAEP